MFGSTGPISVSWVRLYFMCWGFIRFGHDFCGLKKKKAAFALVCHSNFTSYSNQHAKLVSKSSANLGVSSEEARHLVLRSGD